VKKYNLFKIIIILLGIMTLLSWIIPASQYGQNGLEIGDRVVVGIGHLYYYFIRGFQNAVTPIVFILLVGGFYGILNKTGVYTELIDMFANRFKNSRTVLLVTISLILSFITSFTGLTIALFLILPFIISVLMVMKYDKFTILATTIGSILIGFIGSTYGNNIVGTVNNRLSLNFQTEIISRVFLLAIALFLLIVYIINNQKKSNSDKKFEDPLYFEEKKSKKSIWPMIFIIDSVVLIMILSSIAWVSAFKINWFSEMHKTIMTYEILSTPIFGRILGNMPAFEFWSLNEFCMLVIIASIVIVLIYKIKLDSAIEGFVVGAKKLLPTALLIGLIHMTFFITANHLFYFTIINSLLNLTDTFNVITMALVTMIGSVLTFDLMYFSGAMPVFLSIITDTGIYPAISVLIQAIFGFSMLLVPTSIMLIIGLSYLNVSYTEWLKYIYRYAIWLLIVIIIISTSIVLI